MANYNSYCDKIRQENLDRIYKIKDAYFDEFLFYFNCFISSYFKSAKTFGLHDDITKDTYCAFKECISIMKRENFIFNFLLKNIDKMNSDSVEKYLDSLEDLNERTINYYTTVFEDIEDASEIDRKETAKRNKRNFKLLTEDNIYDKMAISLLINNDTLSNILGFEPEFWNHVNNKVKIVDSSVEVLEGSTFIIPILSKDRAIVDFIISVPKVVDFDSAIIAIRRYKDAYSLWKNFGVSFDEYVKKNEYFDEMDKLDNYLLELSKKMKF